MNTQLTLTTLVLVAGLGGCAVSPSSTTYPENTGLAIINHANVKEVISLECLTLDSVPNASYVGPYSGVENKIPFKYVVRDIYCSDLFKTNKYPRGFITIYGSSRIKEDNPICDEKNRNCDKVVKAENDKIYKQIWSFAYQWTQRYGSRYPIMTGAGPGLMEAGSKGAKEAGGSSIGYTTYYDRNSSNDSENFYGGDATKAFNKYITDGLIFSSVTVRESEMIKHSSAIVIAPGGTGTEWEIFQILETIKSNQLDEVPIFIFGNRKMHWKSFDNRLKDMVKRRTIKGDEVAHLVEYASNVDDLINRLSEKLALK